MSKNLSLFWLCNYSSWIFTPWFRNSNKNPSRPSQGDPYMFTVFKYEVLMKLTVFAFLIISESLQSTLPRKKESGRAAHMCFYNVIVWSNSADCAGPLSAASTGTNLSLHSLFHWFQMIPSVSSPPRAPSHHRSSFSPCMCALSIKRSISFRRPQGATSTLAQIGIA